MQERAEPSRYNCWKYPGQEGNFPTARPMLTPQPESKEGC